MNRDFSFIQNYPIKINIYGCRGNIYTLRQSGWDIAIKCNYDYSEGVYILGLCGQHKYNHQKIISKYVQIPLESMRYENIDVLESVEIPCESIAQNINITGEIKYNEYKPFTASVPEFITISQDSFDPYKIPFFSEIGTSKELIVPADTIDDLIKRIHDIQEPKQAELRKKRVEAKIKAEKGEVLQLSRVTNKIEIISMEG